jgi:outer membrane protein assembly factor BamB/plastocyanin
VPLQGSEATLDWYHQVKPHDLFDLDFQMSPILTSATINGQQRDIVIGGGKGGYVVAFDRKAGDIVWYVSVGEHVNDNLQTLPQNQDVKVMPGPLGGIETPMAYANGVVYVPVNNLAAFYTACGIDASKLDFTGGTGELVAIDVNTGQYLWDKQLPSANYGAATVVNDVVFTTTFDGTVYGFNAKTGDQVYKAQLPAGINGWPAVSGDTIIFPAGVGGTPSLVALRVGAGNPLPTPAPKATGTSTTPGAGGGAGGAATTPSAGGTTTPAASGTPSPSSSGTPSGTTTSGATSLTVVGQNIAFDKTTLKAPAGKVTVTFDNKDNGIPHNIHFFKGDNANGESVAASPIKPGPATDTLTMNLQPGTYFYQCDVHPLQMHGTLTVS